MRYPILLFSIFCGSILSFVAYADPHQPKNKQSYFPITGEWSLALDNFRDSSDGSWEGNIGAFTSLNLKWTLPKEYSVQMGGSYGLYDWEGRNSTPSKNSDALQSQAFLTGAASKAGTHPSKLHFGLAYDWMLNQNFGEFAVDPILAQIRGQLGYLFKGGNEFGIWGTTNTRTAHATYKKIPLIFRSINQVNLFWCHYFTNRSYAMLWSGTSCKKSLMHKDKRAGKCIVGAHFNAPLTHSLSVSGHGVYMSAPSASDKMNSCNYAANLCFALTYAFGQCRKAPTPYMTIPDNSTFLVDTNINY